MQPASFAYRRETNVVVSDDEDDDEEGGGENLVGQESITQEGGITSGQVDAISMEVHEGTADTGVSCE